MSTWYYASAERQQLGPVSTDELKQFFHSEQIGMETLVWRDGMLHWRPLHELAQQLGLLPVVAAVEVASALPTVPPPIFHASIADTQPEPEPETVAAPELALQAEPEPAATPVPTAAPTAPAPATAAPRAAQDGRAVFNLGTEPSPAPMPVYPRAAVDAGTVAAAGNPYAAGYSNLQEYAPAPGANEFIVNAGFWKRVAASVIDGIILMVAGGLIGSVLAAVLSDLFGGGVLAEMIWGYACGIALNILYHAWFHSTLAYATPGKMAVGIKVLRSNGEPITFLRGVARALAAYVSAIPVGIGFLLAAFTARKQALHDLMCDTVVVDKWAYTHEPERQRTELGTVTVVVLILFGLALLLVFVGFFMLGLAGAMARG